MTTYTFTPINISQPIGSDVYVAADGIDTAGEVVGSYGYTDGDDDSYFHGFTATGSVGTTFDPPGSSNTNGIGITASGEIFGSYVDWENRQHGFVYSNGAFQQIDVLLASSTIVDGVTNAGTIFGTYVDEFGFGINGFIDNNGSFTILDVPGASTTSVSGLNAGGEIVGTYTDASGQAHGFADINGTFATIDPAGSISTSVAGVSATGEVAGNYENSSSVNNGFIDNNGVITTIVIPGATDTGVSAINDAGEVVGYYADSLGNVHGFIEQNGVTTTIDVPGATETDINGVSDSGIITGFYNDSSYTQHGFVGVPIPAPVVTANNQSVALGQQVALSSLFSVSGSGITQYKVWFSYPEGGSPAVGTLADNGTPIAPDQWVTLNSLSGWEYTGSASPGTDRIWLQASNGQWGEAFANITDPGIPAPVVTANNQSVAAGQQIALSSLFSVSGSGITQYKVWFSYPEGGSPAVGTLTDNGTPIAPDQWVTLSSLSGWEYTGSASPGTDRIWLQAYNGQWSEAFANITDPGIPAPVVTANSQSVATGQQVALSSLFSVSGSGITQYKVWFSYPEGGSPAAGALTDNGTPIAPDQWVTLSSLSGWEYTGSASAGTDRIWLIASNGQSSEAFADITDPGAPAPVVTANNQSVAASQQVTLASLFSVSGSGITQYKVWFSYPEGGSPAVGTLTNNGTPIAPDQWVTLNGLSGWKYTGSATSGTDKIWLIASNGQSSEAVASITDPGLPAPVVTANNQSVATGQEVPVSSLFSVGGNGIIQYKVWFSYPEGGSPAVGTLTDNGTSIVPDQWVTLNSLSGWEYTGSANPGTDRIWLQAYNGQWSEAFADITDPGATSPGNNSASQLSGLGNDQGSLDHTVSLLSQYMASSFANSDFGPSNPVADPKEASQDQSNFLAPAPLAQSHHA